MENPLPRIQCSLGTCTGASIWVVSFVITDVYLLRSVFKSEPAVPQSRSRECGREITFWHEYILVWIGICVEEETIFTKASLFYLHLFQACLVFSQFTFLDKRH